MHTGPGVAMAYAVYKIVVTLCVAFNIVCNGQNMGVATNIYNSLQPLGCGQFLGILNKCSDSVKRPYAFEVQWTLFVPNDTAFHSLSPRKRSEILNMTQEESENYVMAFTFGFLYMIESDVKLSEWCDENDNDVSLKIVIKEKNGGMVECQRLSRRVSFKKTNQKEVVLVSILRCSSQGELAIQNNHILTPNQFQNSGSGVAGPIEYYANGAMVLRANIPAGRSTIHVIDRVLEAPSDRTALSYLSGPGQSDTSFYHELLNYITSDYYGQTVALLNSYHRVTVFVPTREALAKIPRLQMNLLQNNPAQLNEVIQKHIIPHKAMYTSFIYPNEGINSLDGGQIIFRTSPGGETVFVSSGGVTAQIVQGNVTCKNGVVHFIDELLGYTYKTARGEIEGNPLTQTFKDLMDHARNELQEAIVAPSGVTLFVPTNEAFNQLPDYMNLTNNQSLSNMIVEMCMLEPGQEFELMQVNADYEARLVLISSFFRRRISVYREENDLWIESGYVRARVVRSDIGVTNGFVHLIDAVPGVPNHDVPNTIFCEDSLMKASYQLSLTGLSEFMRDTRLHTVAPCRRSDVIQSHANVYTFSDWSNSTTALSTNNSVQTTKPVVCQEGSNDTCRFTVFIPSDVAMAKFTNTTHGQEIQADIERWKYVLQRHMTRKIIYLDQTAIGTEQSFTALSGDLVQYLRASDRYAYLYFKGRISKVLHADLGATNGVVHIIETVLSSDSDLNYLLHLLLLLLSGN